MATDDLSFFCLLFTVFRARYSKKYFSVYCIQGSLFKKVFFRLLHSGLASQKSASAQNERVRQSKAMAEETR